MERPQTIHIFLQTLPGLTFPPVLSISNPDITTIWELQNRIFARLPESTRSQGVYVTTTNNCRLDDADDDTVASSSQNSGILPLRLCAPLKGGSGSGSRRPPASGSRPPRVPGSQQPPASGSQQPPVPGSQRPPVPGSQQQQDSGSQQQEDLGNQQQQGSGSQHRPESRSSSHYQLHPIPGVNEENPELQEYFASNMQGPQPETGAHPGSFVTSDESLGGASADPESESFPSPRSNPFADGKAHGFHIPGAPGGGGSGQGSVRSAASGRGRGTFLASPSIRSSSSGCVSSGRASGNFPPPPGRLDNPDAFGTYWREDSHGNVVGVPPATHEQPQSPYYGYDPRQQADQYDQFHHGNQDADQTFYDDNSEYQTFYHDDGDGSSGQVSGYQPPPTHPSVPYEPNSAPLDYGEEDDQGYGYDDGQDPGDDSGGYYPPVQHY
ncbi:uncharacterized protein Z518_00467 [Rhinocladiella mackenziei CBS 650.93]|uniref:Sde2 ubiquitin domain-containing protein n=1 Tax=Rhinocladiella mackenziei CBS 650.93 TaxID=1442369 RepID=A0A0D2HFB4_9EURO|nr:uncharacterized protein Z518_00467 [Rhinocladiella mackenziei CBS 650.93]KIX09388.1 hypothetical protein Z518_00467 [Rhinocladiella mackenziei CBS 650.93]